MEKSAIVTLRKSAKLTQQALADKAGINIRQVQKMESGESSVRNITLGTAIAVADALGVADLRELL